MKLLTWLPALMGGCHLLHTQIPPREDPRLHDIVEAVSAQRIQTDIEQLVSYGTRNTLSDTVSSTRGIGAARRWIFEEFERIAAACGNCLKVVYLCS